MVIDTGAASRGSGNEGENREKVIRRRFVENNLVEAVILLPEEKVIIGEIERTRKMLESRRSAVPGAMATMPRGSTRSRRGAAPTNEPPHRSRRSAAPGANALRLIPPFSSLFREEMAELRALPEL